MAHAILFPHDSDQVAKDCLSKEHVVNFLKIQFVTEKNNLDKLITDTLGSNNILGRFHIIWQWLAVLNKIHNVYKSDDVLLPSQEEFLHKKYI